LDMGKTKRTLGPAPHRGQLNGPEQALTQNRKVEALLALLEGDLRICDPYTDRRTLDVIGNCTKAKWVRLPSAACVTTPPHQRAVPGSGPPLAHPTGRNFEVSVSGACGPTWPANSLVMNGYEQDGARTRGTSRDGDYVAGV
jgi:hypothetical protein